MVGIVVIAAEHVGFVIILILDCDIQYSHPFPELFGKEFAPGFTAVGMSAPPYIHVSDIVNRFPVLCLQQSSHAGAVDSLFIAEDTECRGTPCFFFNHAFFFF